MLPNELFFLRTDSLHLLFLLLYFIQLFYFDHLTYQEMTEQFTLVTEFSRHFYAMLNRDGAHAPLPNTTAAEKVIKIVGRLREYGENLSRKKKNLMAQDRDYSGIYWCVSSPYTHVMILLDIALHYTTLHITLHGI